MTGQIPLRQGRRALRVSAALAGVIALAACSGSDRDAATTPSQRPSVAPTTPPASPTPPPEPEFVAEDVRDLGELCGADEVRYANAARYRGDGPHPIAVFELDHGADEYEIRLIPLQEQPGYDPEQPDEVALLGCLRVVEVGLPVGACQYDTDDGPKEVQVDGARFEIELYALATGELISRSEFIADFCPPTLITFRGQVPDQLTSTMNTDHLVEVFDEYVNGTAR